MVKKPKNAQEENLTSQGQKSAYEEIFFDILPLSLKAVTRYNVPLKELTGEKTRLILDYLIIWHEKKFGFEIDGHRSHYRDGKQIERDTRKDALCKKHGILLFRVTGRLVERRPAIKKLVKKWVFSKENAQNPVTKTRHRRYTNASE